MTYGCCVYHELECDYSGPCRDCPHNTEWFKQDEEKTDKALEQEPSVEIVKGEESNDNGTKYLNINVSDAEVKRNPDIVRLCSDVGILEYMKKAESEG